MIQNYRLGMKFKEEVLAENKGVSMSDQEIGQRVMMKMRAHMLKNAPKGSFHPQMSHNPENKEPSK